MKREAVDYDIPPGIASLNFDEMNFDPESFERMLADLDNEYSENYQALQHSPKRLKPSTSIEQGLDSARFKQSPSFAPPTQEIIPQPSAIAARTCFIEKVSLSCFKFFPKLKIEPFKAFNFIMVPDEGELYFSTLSDTFFESQIIKR